MAVWPPTGSGTRAREGGSARLHSGVCILVGVSHQISVQQGLCMREEKEGKKTRFAPGFVRNQSARRSARKTRRGNETRDEDKRRPWKCLFVGRMNYKPAHEGELADLKAK